MSDIDRDPKTLTGLALSGGGFRAVLFHCGALMRLNDVGLLPRLDRITSVSGGSIVAGRLAVAWSRLAFDPEGRATNLVDEVIAPLREFCAHPLDLPVILGGLVPFTPGISDRLAAAYDEGLLHGATLADLPERPDFVLKAANLGTGRVIRFSRTGLWDYRLGHLPAPEALPLSRAVAASSAFPPWLSPVRLATEAARWQRFDGADLFDRSDLRSRLELTDGGVYDNMGLERIDHFGTVLVSDAGAAFALQNGFDMLSPRQILRVISITMDQVRALRLRLLFKGMEADPDRRLCYWRIGSDLDPDRLPDRLRPLARGAADLSKVRTRLNAFSEAEQAALINWGYVVSGLTLAWYLDTGDVEAIMPPVPG
ncbi:patatin-like phospholipase family protein [Roseivivax marinus]|uniref:patatin-like phospholipase family protein n=1 Tax=Roseivivax marinus TaxID=1379903 RepID=UPI001F03AB4D|nr:patatin-like phospholipase family protein [Roseivivax marinus]UMA63455.1 patatin-like phospholipase family protein [Roseivivax marinus]